MCQLSSQDFRVPHIKAERFRLLLLVGKLFEILFKVRAHHLCGLTLARRKAVFHTERRARDVLDGVEDAHGWTEPIRIAPCRPNRWVVKEAGGLNAPRRDSFCQPRLVDRLTKITSKPLAPRLILVPRLEERRATCRVAAVERLHEDFVRLSDGRTDLLFKRLGENLERAHAVRGINRLDIHAFRQSVHRTSRQAVLARVHCRRFRVLGRNARAGQDVFDGLPRRFLGEEQRKERLDDGGCKLRVRVAADLLQCLDDRGEVWDATILFRS